MAAVVMAIGSQLVAGATAAGSAMAGAASSLGSVLGFGGGAAATATGAGAAAGTAAHAGVGITAVGAGASSAAAGSSTLSLLSGASSALGAFSTFASALSEKRALDQQAMDAEVAARQDEIIGLQEGNEILDQALSTLARQRVTIGASGVSAFTGTAANVIRQGERDTDAAVELSGSRSATRSIRRRRQARTLRSAGRGTIAAGITSAAGQGFEGAANLRRIG